MTTEAGALDKMVAKLDAEAQLTCRYTVERWNRGPEPEWHQDRKLFGPWCAVALVVRTVPGPLAAVLGTGDADAWFRLPGELRGAMGWLR